MESSGHYKVEVAALVAVSLIVMFIVGVLLVFLLTRFCRHERSTVSPPPRYLPGFLTKCLMLFGSRKKTVSGNKPESKVK